MEESAKDVGRKQQQQLLKDLEKHITCPVCKNFFREAKLLSCNHYCCVTCLEKLVRFPGRQIGCPQCHRETTLPPGGVAGLHPVLFIERMKVVYDKVAKAEGKVKAVCELCTAAKSAVAFCQQCDEFICSDCVYSHKQIKIFANHAVASFEDLKKGDAKHIFFEMPPPLPCAEHGEPTKLFCFDCGHSICRDCTIIDHSRHRFEFLSKCAPESRQTLGNSVASLKGLRANIASVREALGAEAARVDQRREEVGRTIERSFNQLKAALDERKAELIRNANSLARKNKAALKAQMKVLQVAQEDTQRLMDFVEKNLEMTSDRDLMSIHPELQSRMEEEKKRCHPLQLEPTPTVDIVCNLPTPDIFPRNFGAVYNQSIVFNVNSCELGSPIQVCLTTPGATVKDISASLRCVANPSSCLEGKVAQNGVGIFSISVIPQTRGRHDVIVKIKDKEIAGSPFRVFVKFPPFRMGKTEPRVITGLQDTHAITINSRGQLVVIEHCDVSPSKKKVTIIEKDGRKVQTIGCDGFQNPRGVAVAPDGAVYISDVGAKRLFKFNPNGELLKTVPTKLKSLLPVKIIDNQLYVVDCDSQQVLLFDTDCQLVGTIKTKECPEPRDVAKGPHGLYVAGEGVISVYQCAPNGVFSHHLNLTPSSLEFSWFRNICCDTSGHIIVTDCGNGLYVFKPSGECVGHVSCDVIQSPAGVVVDEDGYVYVCSMLGSKVFVL